MTIHIVHPDAEAVLSPFAEGGARFVCDPGGYTWRVSEREPPPHLRHRCERCLIFDAGSVVRRVCGQGADWQRLSDAELLALCVAPE